MSTTAADAFITRLGDDDDFSARLLDAHGDPDAVRALVAEAGYDATPEEIRDALLEHYGSELSEEQLAEIAGGMPGVAVAAITVSAVGLAAAAAGSAAAAA